MPDTRRAGSPFSAGEVDGSCNRRFRVIAATHADRIALAFPGSPMTYADLEALTDRFAAAIAASASRPQAHIAVAMKEGLSAVAAMIGVLKSGHVFLPIDPTWPLHHRNTVLASMRADLLFTDTATEGATLPVLEWHKAAAHAPVPVLNEARPDDPACLYFTSGSTGEPRGIALSHRCLLHAARTYVLQMETGPEDRVAWTSPVSVGASLLPIMSSLFSGASLHRFLVGRDGFRTFVTRMNETGITIWPSVTSLFRSIAELLPPGPNLPSLRIIKLGGEAVRSSDATLFDQRIHDGCTLMNGLGITECGGNVCWHRHERGAQYASRTVPVGRAVEGMTILIIDETDQPAPAGEIVVRSRYLSSGFWNPVTQRIDPWPGCGSDGITEFHTRDLARLDTEGRIVHEGRVDGVLKVRGHRVERSSIENALRRLPWIGDAAVIMETSGGSDHLAAFLVYKDRHIPATVDLQKALTELVPTHGIPSRFYTLEQMPRLAGGKINYRELASAVAPEASKAPAPDTLERQMLVLWRKALGRQHVSIDEDFFASGGDSLAAVRFFALLDQRMGINLPLSILTQHRTVRALAGHVRQTGNQPAASSAHLLQAGDHRTPLFCFPGAGSDSLALLELAESLDPRQTVYAMSYAGLSGGEDFQDRIPDMAVRFLRDIRRIQPSGPYALAGTSFGGWVAFDVAQRLTRSGETVALLALLDAFGPGYPEPHPHPSWRRRLLLATRWWLPLGNKEELSLSNLADGVREKAARWTAHVLRALNPGRLLPLPLRYLHLQDCCFAAGKAYRPEPYAGGPIHLFRAEIQPPSALFRTSPDMGWSSLASRGLHIHHVPGRHGAHIRKPNVIELARQLMPCLPGLIATEPGRFVELRDQSRDRWNALADWWDRQCGDEGHADTRDLLLPLCLQLLNTKAGDHIIDAGCGNGWIARRLARLGARVTAFDYSDNLLDNARRRDPGSTIVYRRIDATRSEQLAELGHHQAAGAICYMALMDIADITPLMESLQRAIRPGGAFVFAMIHPDSAGLARAGESQALTNLGKADQPVEHYYFHRPLPLLLDLFEKTGWELDQLSAPTSPEGAQFLVGRLISTG